MRETRIVRITAIFVAISLIWLIYRTYQPLHALEDTAVPGLTNSNSPITESSTSCPPLPGSSDVLVVIKTGATEASVRIPPILSSFGVCIPNVMIFSDLDQQIESHRIHDALKSVSTEYRENSSEFEFYRSVHKAYYAQVNVTAFGQLDRNAGKAWTLDKWKNIPILHEAYQKYPNVKWYVFIDADTFLAFHNVVQTLDKLNHTLPLYIGAANNYDGELTFAHGGSGYIISAGAAAAFERIYDREHIDKWEAETAITCCGDVMLGMAMRDAGIKLRNAAPLVQFATIPEISWSSRTWCEPSWTWHHVEPWAMKELFDFDRRWHQENQGFYRFKHLFLKFVKPSIADTKTNWDNLSTDRVFKIDTENQTPEEQKAVTLSPSQCQAACLEDQGCVQWVWKTDLSCGHNWSLRLGHPVQSESEPGFQTVSGWILHRTEALEEEWNRRPCRSRWNA
ncbi:uncharacterized protein Z520_08579 [Fonsecaea multimorphosa CBS 102226]|uniref:N-acetylgalactosaminide beta-1,3-galactosyltransferase n=1 Tax=Fonsecaea multimorphosa CBS 102226 TaxID=1442371 RepID=A0A0D2IFK0_9EURO|nr:uncharacterized protein Z520_08579 [Fonsecaea multimorphosa CBS 102226]KIX95871.1 hypothetical protein Z520_08579 [Fonsecaea multimorphosa CBS 102226]